MTLIGKFLLFYFKTERWLAAFSSRRHSSPLAFADRWPFVLTGGEEWLCKNEERLLLFCSRTLDLQRDMRSILFVLLATGAFAGTWFYRFHFTSRRFYSLTIRSGFCTQNTELYQFCMFLDCSICLRVHYFDMIWKFFRSVDFAPYVFLVAVAP